MFYVWHLWSGLKVCFYIYYKVWSISTMTTRNWIKDSACERILLQSRSSYVCNVSTTNHSFKEHQATLHLFEQECYTCTCRMLYEMALHFPIENYTYLPLFLTKAARNTHARILLPCSSTYSLVNTSYSLYCNMFHALLLHACTTPVPWCTLVIFKKCTRAYSNIRCERCGFRSKG